jgi:uncharacterized caspase-like protein
MIGKLFSVVAGFCLLAAVTLSSAQAEPRLALVMGNSNYGKEIGKLPNPANDATAMAAALQQTGFKVTKVVDADWKSMKRAIVKFGEDLSAAGPQATGLFFYAGHGVQVKGENFLVPIGADISKEADVEIETVSANAVLDQMEFAGSRVNIVILDACRNNPMGRSVRSATRGLAPMDSVRGTFIAYSTSPGQVAADGSGANSPYTAALAKTIVRPGLGIEEAFREVRGQVMAATGDEQVPWDSSSLTAPFIFKPTSFTPANKPAAAAPTLSKADAEKEVWRIANSSNQPGDYEAYLASYPNGEFAAAARSRLATLGGGNAPLQQPKVDVPAAAPAPAPTPEPAPSEASTSSAPKEESSGGLFGSGKKPEVDSNGVDCRIMDANRSASDCRNTKRFAPANKPNRS